MRNRQWTREEEDVLIKNYNRIPTIQIAEMLGRTVASVNNRVQYMRDGEGRLRSAFPVSSTAEAEISEPVTERVINVSNDEGTITVSGIREEVCNLDDLIRICKIGPEWRVESYTQKAYQGFIKNAEGQIQTVQLFSISAKVKSNRDLNTIRMELEAMVSEARGHLQAPPPRASSFVDSGILVSVNVTDLHLGKLAWAPESGQNWDLKIAQQVYWDAIYDVTEKIRVWNPEKIILTVGSDLLNADNSENTTTGGRPQSTDGRQTKTLRAAWQLKRDTIEHFRRMAPVHVVVFPGNHDALMSFAIGEILSVAFEGFADVTIDNTPTNMKYAKWGDCLLAYVHGNGVKPRDIVETVSEEKAEWWGQTIHRGAESGHLHDQAVFEFRGMTVYRNPALCAPEDWHKGRMFVGKMRALHCRVWDKLDGAIAQISSKPLAPHRMPGFNLG
jgi:hypothetical protein